MTDNVLRMSMDEYCDYLDELIREELGDGDYYSVGGGGGKVSVYSYSRDVYDVVEGEMMIFDTEYRHLRGQYQIHGLHPRVRFTEEFCRLGSHGIVNPIDIIVDERECVECGGYIKYIPPHDGKSRPSGICGGCVEWDDEWLDEYKKRCGEDMRDDIQRRERLRSMERRRCWR